MEIAGNLYILKAAIEISILWFVIYHVLLFFEGTRAVQVLRGIVILLFAFLLFDRLHFEVLDWLLNKLFGISVIAILIIFHPEIRQGLGRLGQRNIFNVGLKEEEINRMLKEIGDAVERICRRKIGALIAIERNIPLTAYIESGVTIDSRISADLIETVFTPNNPLHDGGLIIQQARMVAAGCLFPLSQNKDISRMFGTRHRAALGLSEETDAIIIVVSEERQDISLVYRGRLHKDLSREDLFSEINKIIKVEKGEHAKT